MVEKIILTVKETDIKASLIDRIIVTSGRGKPHNLPEKLRYLNFSIVSQYMIENRYKYLLTQAVTSARRITEISG